MILVKVGGLRSKINKIGIQFFKYKMGIVEDMKYHPILECQVVSTVLVPFPKSSVKIL